MMKRKNVLFFFVGSFFVFFLVVRWQRMRRGCEQQKVEGMRSILDEPSRDVRGRGGG